MTVHSKLQFCNERGQIVRTYKTKAFTGATTMKVIEDYILKKYSNAAPPFDIRILDQPNGPITLDQDHLDEYGPFDSKNMDATTAAPVNSSQTTVTLQIFLPGHILGSTIDQEYVPIPEEVLKANISQVEQMHRADFKTNLEPPKYSITLSQYPKMGFVHGHNVNHKQRDQYICDEVNVASGDTTGKLIMLQGEKTSTNKRKSVLPRFRIWNDDIKIGGNHVWTLLVYIVLDVCKAGKRSLSYHSQRAFVKNVNLKEYSNPYEFPVTTVDWLSDMGVELKLTTVVMEGTKTRPNMPLNIICTLKNIEESGSPDYCKSCLAHVLRKDGIIQWETLVLSNEMIFIKYNSKNKIINNLDVWGNTSSALVKRKCSKKSRTTSNQRSKRAKPQRINSDSSIQSNQNPPMNYDDRQNADIAPQTIPTNLIHSSEIDRFLEDIESLNGNSFGLSNNASANPDFSDNTDMSNNLSDIDYSLFNYSSF